MYEYKEYATKNECYYFLGMTLLCAFSPRPTAYIYVECPLWGAQHSGQGMGAQSASCARAGNLTVKRCGATMFGQK